MQPTVEQLIRDLQNRDPVTRSAAAWALRETRDVRAVSALIRALGDHESQVRSSAAHALGQIGNMQAAGALRQALKDEYGLVRTSAAEALGQLGDKQAVGPLIEALKDKKPAIGGAVVSAAQAKPYVDGVHKVVVEALKTITGQDFGRDAARWDQWWRGQQAPRTAERETSTQPQAKKMKKCPACGGEGRLEGTNQGIKFEGPCDLCDGRGEVTQEEADSFPGPTIGKAGLKAGLIGVIAPLVIAVISQFLPFTGALICGTCGSLLTYIGVGGLAGFFLAPPRTIGKGARAGAIAGLISGAIGGAISFGITSILLPTRELDYPGLAPQQLTEKNVDPTSLLSSVILGVICAIVIVAGMAATGGAVFAAAKPGVIFTPRGTVGAPGAIKE